MSFDPRSVERTLSAVSMYLRTSCAAQLPKPNPSRLKPDLVRCISDVADIPVAAVENYTPLPPMPASHIPLTARPTKRMLSASQSQPATPPQSTIPSNNMGQQQTGRRGSGWRFNIHPNILPKTIVLQIITILVYFLVN